MSEPPRLLNARSQYGYTSRTVEAMSGEPEAVSSAEQRDQTTWAAKQARARQRELIDAAVERMRPELELLQGALSERKLLSHVRAMQRQLAHLRELSR